MMETGHQSSGATCLTVSVLRCLLCVCYYLMSFVCTFEVTDAELRLLFHGHVDVFSEVRDRMSLGLTEVIPIHVHAHIIQTQSQF